MVKLNAFDVDPLVMVNDVCTTPCVLELVVPLNSSRLAAVPASSMRWGDSDSFVISMYPSAIEKVTGVVPVAKFKISMVDVAFKGVVIEEADRI